MIQKLSCRVFDIEQSYVKLVKKLLKEGFHDFFFSHPFQVAVREAGKPSKSEKSLPSLKFT